MPPRPKAIVPQPPAQRVLSEGPAARANGNPVAGPLCGGDLMNLRASGLTNETIRANDLRTERDPVELATTLNRLPDCPPKQIPEFCRRGGLIFPYRDLDGVVNGFARVKPHCPRVSNGQPVKYEQPVGEP